MAERPNGLVHVDGLWRLFVQHRADAPALRATGWAQLSSPDLGWTWDRPVIAATGDDWAYFGSVSPPLDWRRCHRAVLAALPTRDLTLFVDGPAIELFIAPDGAAVSVALPTGDRPLAVRCTVAGVEPPIAGHVREPSP